MAIIKKECMDLCIFLLIFCTKVSIQIDLDSCNSFNETLDFGFESKLQANIKDVIWNRIKSDGDASLAKYEPAENNFEIYYSNHPQLKNRVSREGTSNLKITNVENDDRGRFTVTIRYNNSTYVQSSEIKLTVSDICFNPKVDGQCKVANCYAGTDGYMKDTEENIIQENNKNVLSVRVCDSTKAGNYSCCSTGLKARCSVKFLDAAPPSESTPMMINDTYTKVDPAENESEMKDSPSSSLGTGAIVAIVIGVLVLIAAVVVGIVLYKRREHQKNTENRFKGEETALRSNENHEPHEQPEA